MADKVTKLRANAAEMSPTWLPPVPSGPSDRCAMLRQVALSVVAATGLAGCDTQSKGERAEERYVMMVKGGDTHDKCAPARMVEAAYLEELNERKYRDWRLTADITCQNARLGG